MAEEEESRAHFVRSLSESIAKCEIGDESLGGSISKGLEECWREELFFDVDLFTMEMKVIKCHKIVLASVSPFFKAAFSPLHQNDETAVKDRIELTNIPYGIMKLICEFVYTRSIEFPVKDLQELIMAANFLQLYSLERKCAELIHENTDESNLLEVTRFAKQAGILPLIALCKSFLETNFGKILHTDLIYNFTADELEQVLCSFNIVIRDSHGIVPPLSIQEKLILKAVIKFVQLKFVDKNQRHETFCRLLKHIRLDEIMKFERKSILEILSKLEDRALEIQCVTAFKQTETDKPIADQTEKAEMILPRSHISAIPYTSQKLAHGYETNVQGKFDDHKPGVDIYVKGMKIWIRRWDGRPVYGAIEVLYSDGSKIFHGQRSNHEIYEFILGADEYIIKVIANSGYMVDNLEFVTNTGKSYGPYGGDGGGRRILEHRTGYLAYISGWEVLTQGSLGIVSLSFHWMHSPVSESENESDSNSRSSSVSPDFDHEYPLYFE